MNLALRLKNYISRCEQFADAIKPAFYAPVFFACRHFNPRFLFTFRYKKTTFHARNVDYSAIREVFFENEYAFLTPYLKQKEKPVVLDLGAHIGLFALWVLEQNPESEILSVEASPDTYKILERTRTKAVQDSAFSWKSIHRAAWKNNDMISFAGSGDSMSHHVGSDGSVKVQGMDFKELLQLSGHDKINLMKVDIEGAEEAFLCENPDLLKNVDSLVIELHAKYCDADRVRRMLHEQFPVIETLSGRASSKAVLYCTRGANA